MTYVKDFMTQALEHHILDKVSDTHYIMRKPDTGNYLVHVAEVGRHIVLTGDLQIGGLHGCVSAGGYTLNWFSKELSEDYLCSKFLSKEWQWEVAAETLQDWLDSPLVDTTIEEHEHRARIQAILDADTNPTGFYWDYDVPSQHELYRELEDMYPGYIDDGVPGYDWPRTDAGWLVAVNRRFTELMKENNA